MLGDRTEVRVGAQGSMGSATRGDPIEYFFVARDTKREGYPALCEYLLVTRAWSSPQREGGMLPLNTLKILVGEDGPDAAFERAWTLAVEHGAEGSPLHP